MARTHEISFRLGAQMAGSFAKTMTSATGALGQLNNKMGQLNRQQSSIGGLVKMRKEVAESTREYRQARDRVAELGRAISRTRNPTREMTREFDRAQRSVTKAKNRLNEKRQSLRELNTQLGTTGTSTKELMRRQQELAKSANRAKSAQTSLQKTLSAQQQNVAKRGQLRGQLFDAAAMAVAVGAPIRIAANFEQAMSKVGSIANATDDELAQMTSTARELGGTTEWSASQAAEGMRFLSMAGFDATQTVEAMPGMLDLASAGAIELGEAANIASNVLSGFNMEAGEAGRLGDVLTNTFTSSNTDLQMLGKTMEYAAPVATRLGVSLEQASAMAGVLGDSGIQGSKAGTRMVNVMNRLTAPTGKAAKVMEKLDVEVTDMNDDMRDMPTILAEMHEAMQGYGSGVRGEMRQAVFGMEAAGAAAILMGEAASGNLQEYTESLDKTGTASKVAKQQQDNVAGAMRRLSSAGESIAITLGSTLLPTIASGAQGLAAFTGVIDGLAQQFPLLTTVVVGGTAALVALRIASIAGGYAYTFLKGAVLQVTAAVKTARVAYLLHTGALNANIAASQKAVAMSKVMALTTKAMAGAQWLFNAALLANPIGLVVAAIVSLIAWGAVLYQHWDLISAFLSGVWQAILDGLGPVTKQFKNLLASLGPVASAFGWVWDKVKALFSAFTSLFTPVEYSDEALRGATNAGYMFGSVISAAMKIILLPLRVMIKLLQIGIDFYKRLFSGAKWALSGIADVFKSFNPLSWFISAMQSVRSWLGRFSLFSAGKKLLSTMASGIKSAVSVPVNAVKGALSRVRRYLPFSDAKEGPLSELTSSGASIMKTLSAGMQSVGKSTLIGPFAKTAQSLMQRVKDSGMAGSAMDAVGGSGIASALRELTGTNNSNGGARGGSTIQLNVEQNISLGSGSGGDAYQQARSGAAAGARDLMQELDRAMQRERRLSYE